MNEIDLQNIDFEKLNGMSFEELYTYAQDWLSTLESSKTVEFIENTDNQEKVSKLIELLHSKYLTGLVKEKGYSSKKLKEEMFQKELKKNRILRKSNKKWFAKKIKEISEILPNLINLNEQLSKNNLNQELIEEAYLQMLQLSKLLSFDMSKYENPAQVVPSIIEVKPERKYSIAISYKTFDGNSYIQELSQKELEKKPLLKKFETDVLEIVNEAIEKVETLIDYYKEGLGLVDTNIEIIGIDDFEEIAKEQFEKEIKQKFSKEIENRITRIVALRSRKKKLFSKSLEDIKFKKLPWKFFPEGTWTVEQIVKEFGKYVPPNKKVDEERIWKIYDNSCYAVMVFYGFAGIVGAQASRLPSGRREARPDAQV